ncbi:MAG: hypothetical protein HZB51_20525 [Chloroflexi bacterium]|nr:hypothetical protein [Chloroflexota bacterium]
MTRTILIGTEDSNIAYLLQRYAEESGFQTLCVHPGNSLFDQARAAQPALIILDIEHDNPADQDSVRQLKAEPTTCHIPIIIYSYLDELSDALRAHIDGYLPKAVMYEDFMALIQRIDSRQSSNETAPHTRGGI